ncbi:MAG: hypothetical protein R6V02_03205 [Candidatus Aminicenantes bacterium]
MNSRILLGMVVIAVVMIFVAAATNVFWLGRAAGAFPPSFDIPPHIYSAFGLPDLVLSLFLYVGAAGLLKRKPWGLYISLVGLGMWLFDSLLVLGITGTERIGIVGPSLAFNLFAVSFLIINSRFFISE